MYKVGDKVRVTDPFYEGLYNTIREVVKVDDMYIYIEDGTSSPYPMKEREIELVKEPEFKVGDKVKVIGKGNPTHNFGMGEVVSVLEYIPTTGNYKCEGSKFPQVVNKYHLELVKEEKMGDVLMPLYVESGLIVKYKGEEVPRSRMSVGRTAHDIFDMLEDGVLEVVNKEIPNPRVVRAAECASSGINALKIIRQMTGCSLGEASAFKKAYVTLYPE